MSATDVTRLHAWVRGALSRSRLVLWIYVMGLAQFALVALGLVLFSRQPHHASHVRETARYVSANVAAAQDPASELRHAHETLTWGLELVADDGAVVAREGETVHRAASEAPWGPSWEKLTLADGRGATLFFDPGKPAPPPGFTIPIVLILVVALAMSWVAARSLARPLTVLSRTARAFGRGDLGARARLDRRDELGDVAQAFDEMADRVARALRAEKELLANVSHELRTPLQRISLALDLAREGDAETARASLAELAEDLGELERIVDDVLTAARLSLSKTGTIDPARTPLRLEPLDARDAVGRAVTRFRASHPARALRVHLPEDSLPLVADPVLLRRAVDNLLENAHKYSDDAASDVDIALRRADALLEIVVTDHGIGIAEEDLARVTEPFFRADKSRTRATGGLGLGLALSKQIVMAHQGSLSLSSEVDGGTVATIRLPLASPAGGVTARPEIARGT